MNLALKIEKLHAARAIKFAFILKLLIYYLTFPVLKAKLAFLSPTITFAITIFLSDKLNELLSIKKTPSHAVAAFFIFISNKIIL